MEAEATHSFAGAEEEILKYWDQIDAFKTSLKLSEGKPEYTFYDGPPFATGLPHYGTYKPNEESRSDPRVELSGLVNHRALAGWDHQGYRHPLCTSEGAPRCEVGLGHWMLGTV
jgi:isoleucyl-tRNA synthetase